MQRFCPIEGTQMQQMANIGISSLYASYKCPRCNFIALFYETGERYD